MSGDGLAQAIKAYEGLTDLLGRIGSYAQLYYVGDTTDPQRAKFYGDANAKLTDISTLLLFFELELNRIEDEPLERRCKVPALAHYRPWIENLRKEKPYQLDDKLEELFLEKSQTGYSAWNRLFDETMAELRFDGRWREADARADAHSAAGRPIEAKRKAAAEALAKTFKENLRLFTHITNTLAKDKEISDRWRGFKDIADARHLSNRVEPEVVAALVRGGARGLSAPLASLLPDEGEMARQGQARALGPQRALAAGRYPRCAWDEAQATVLDAYRGFAPEMAEIAGRSSTSAGSMRR